MPNHFISPLHGGYTVPSDILPFPTKQPARVSWIHEVFEVDGIPHQLAVRITSDRRYEATLVNLSSGASCPRLSEAAVRVLASRFRGGALL